MTFDPLFASILIAGIVVIGLVVLVPILKPLFSPVTDLIMHPQPEQKYLLRGILGIGILAFAALIIFAITQFTRTDTLVTPDPVEALPTTYPSETPVPD